MRFLVYLLLLSLAFAQPTVQSQQLEAQNILQGLWVQAPGKVQNIQSIDLVHTANGLYVAMQGNDAAKCQWNESNVFIFAKPTVKSDIVDAQAVCRDQNSLAILQLRLLPDNILKAHLRIQTRTQPVKVLSTTNSILKRATVKRKLATKKSKAEHHQQRLKTKTKMKPLFRICPSVEIDCYKEQIKVGSFVVQKKLSPNAKNCIVVLDSQTPCEERFPHQCMFESTCYWLLGSQQVM